MRVKVDEDLPEAASALLRDRGHDSLTVLDQKMGGLKDAPLWVAVQAEGRFLVTSDKGFGDIRVYPPGTHAGVLVLRPDRDGIEPLLTLLRQVNERCRLEDLARTVSVATPRGVRSRRPAPER